MINTVNKISHSFIKYLILVIVIITMIGAVASHSLAAEGDGSKLIRRANNQGLKSLPKGDIKEIVLGIVKDNLWQSKNADSPGKIYSLPPGSLNFTPQKDDYIIIPDSAFFRQKEINEVLSNITKYGLNQLPNLDFKGIVQKAINKEIILVPVENIQINSKDIISIAIANRGLIAFAVDKKTIQKAAQGQANTIDTQGFIAFKADEITNIIEKTINLEGFKKADKVEVSDGVVRIVAVDEKQEYEYPQAVKIAAEQKVDIIPSSAASDTPPSVISEEGDEEINANGDTDSPAFFNEHFSGDVLDGNDKPAIFKGMPEAVRGPYSYPLLKSLVYPYPFGPPLAYNTALQLQLDDIKKALAAKANKPQDKSPPIILSSTAKSHIQQASIALLRELNTSFQYHQHFDLPELRRNLSLTSSQFNNPFLSPPDKVPN